MMDVFVNFILNYRIENHKATIINHKLLIGTASSGCNLVYVKKPERNIFFFPAFY